MTLPFTLPDWMPWWVPILLLVPAILYALAVLFMPFSVIGVKGRLEAIEARLDEIQGEIRSLVLRMPETARTWPDARRSRGFPRGRRSPPRRPRWTRTTRRRLARASAVPPRALSHGHPTARSRASTGLADEQAGPMTRALVPACIHSRSHCT